LGYNTTSGVNKKRLFYQFGTSALNPKIIRSATFKAYEVFSYSCTASDVEAWETSGTSSSTNWNNQPVWRVRQDTRSVAYGRDGCSPGGAWVSFDVAQALRASQSRGSSNTTIGLRASAESSNTGWKRFKSNATLSVEYNTAPATPTSARTLSPTTSCVIGSARPAIPRVDPPTLVARISDADSAKGQTVRGQFEIWNATHTARSYTANTAYKLAGGDFSVNAPTLADGVYAWRVSGYDALNSGPWSPWCEFVIDGTAPATPTISSVTESGFCAVDSVPAESNDAAPCRSGELAKFHFSTNDPGATRFRWSLNAQVPTSPYTAPSAPDFGLLLATFGPNVVRVWSYDAAGNVSPAGDLGFRVAGARASGWWRMDETSGPLGDISSAGRTLSRTGTSVSAGGRWSPVENPDLDPTFTDPTDQAVAFDGLTGSAAASAAVAQAGQAWTVSAWVKLDAPVAGRSYLLSQDLGGASWGLGLYADPADSTHQDGRWGFAVNDGARSKGMGSAGNVVPGQWTHLVGVYNPGTQEMALYVDGELDSVLGDATVPVQTTATATGPFRVAALMSTTVHFWWPGRIDEVRTFAGAYDDAQAQRLSASSRPALP
jgi:Concanavalin A-like lectin/glucanases superfamily